MARGAAFFDLDRTLLRKASGPVFTEALVTAGVAPARQIPGIGLVYRANDLLGESAVAMGLARMAATVAKGWAPEAVRQASEQAAARLAEEVVPYARPLLDEHRKAGRPVVMATTTPYDMVAPLAARLEIDDVVATRYAVRDGVYTGGLDGPFVWGRGKLEAVRAWAAAHDVDVAESWAYSDSVFDVPLLSAVGHPVAVNPDLRLQAVAFVRRWPVRHLDVPPGVPKVAGVEPFDLLRPALHPVAYPYARFDIDGTDRIPRTGPAIVVANHRSYFDTVAMAVSVGGVGRPIRFLGKAEVFDAPVIGPLARALGGIRVDRGTGSDEPLRAAADALDGGQLVALMPQGTIPRGEAFFDPVLKGRWGAARLAAMTRAPVIPIGLWGTERVWPRSSRVPNVANVLRAPTVRVRVGAPVALDYGDAQVDTDRIMAAIMDLLPPEARERHDPTAEELARTRPPS
ncbi:MAG: HAD-IB family hydrolase [Acidimicrobiia bacterium]|nr:HAD-IB family hydrolase [Acidimicrobiia bacterium]